MDESLQKKIKRVSPINPRAIAEFTAYVANTPMVQHEDLVKKAIEMGYNPYDLIDASLGSIKYEKSSSSLSDNLEDILNSVYEKDPTPGKRYIVDPSDISSPKAKKVIENLGKNVGIAQSLNIGKSRSLPDYIAILQRKNELEKLKAISDAGHELEHQSDFLTRPNFTIKTEKPFEKGHHFKDIYETSELIREAKNLPVDEKKLNEIAKQSKKSYLKPSIFGKLRNLLAPIASAIGTYSALKSGDTLGAALEAGSLADPTGVLDVAAEVNRRSKLTPEEQEDISREDRYSAMPFDISNEQRTLQDLEKYDDKGNLYSNIRKKLK